MSDEAAEIAGSILAFLGIVALVIAAIVFVIIPIIIVSMGTGAIYGGGLSVYNYAVAFDKNVKPEKI